MASIESRAQEWRRMCSGPLMAELDTVVETAEARFGTDPRRTRAIQERIYRSGWKYSRRRFRSPLLEALEYLDAQQALDVFEACPNLEDLARRAQVVRRLNSRWSFHRNLADPSQTVDAFVGHLHLNRESLVATGHPVASFERLPLLDLLLGRLHYTKAPLMEPRAARQAREGLVGYAELVTQHQDASWCEEVGYYQTQHPMATRLSRKDTGDLQFDYAWSVMPPLEDRGDRRFGGFSHLRSAPLEWTRELVLLRGMPLPVTRYEDAPRLVRGLDGDFVELESRREKVFVILVSLLPILAMAVRHREPEALWQETNRVLRTHLSRDGLHLICEAEASFREMHALGHVEGIGHDNTCLSGLLRLVGLLEAETRLQASAKLRVALSSVGIDVIPHSYFTLCPNDHRKDIDAALDLYHIEEVEAARIADGARHRAPTGLAANRLPDASHGHGAAGAECPAPNVFRKRGEVWELRYCGGAILHYPVRGNLGIAYLQHLLQNAFRSFSYQEIEEAAKGIHDQAGDSTLSSMSRSQLRSEGFDSSWNIVGSQPLPGVTKNHLKQAEELQSALEEALELHDEERVAVLREKISDLSTALNQARPREKERQRSRVRNAIGRAVERIETKDKDLADHLRRSLKDGRRTYQPPEKTPWEF